MREERKAPRSAPTACSDGLEIGTQIFIQREHDGPQSPQYGDDGNQGANEGNKAKHVQNGQSESQPADCRSNADAGTGAARLFPRLAGSSAVQSDDATTLIHAVLFGSQAAATPGAPTGPAMPSFAWRLGDAQAAAVLTYIRNAWGNAAATVSPDQIRTVRGKRGHLD